MHDHRESAGLNATAEQSAAMASVPGIGAEVRGGFVALLDAQDGIEVVGEADNGEQAVRLTRSLRPDVVLMDIRMPILDGLAATRIIAEDPRLADVRVVVLTTFELDEYVFEAIRSGATGFLVKHTEPADLVRA